ncbi:tRNA1(Val) (adenine(37)-N6)-methyltransferase [Haliovirga abyssi]|uniref:Methyltransferase n=1 Tax=Haliovirga abyssi TaxID=2996794 RepID=A0AAU9DYW9_9FUSO|nr:tRNA1(Val) (adenine(37)-N6)-methyltransferase [Haliovirga abyssi]BDU51721.1 methyltransferase [Haliovirga abyssi]
MKKNGEEVLIDFLDIPNMKIFQKNDHFNFSIDSVLLANFLTINRKLKNITELGFGNGAVSLLLSKRTSAKITGIEILKDSYELAKKNININNLENRIEIIHDDMKNWKKHLKEQSQDAVISNPPFFKNSDINNLDQLSIARHEIAITLEEIIFISGKLLRNMGYFAIVHRAERFYEILNIMKKNKIEPKRIKFCYTTKNKNSKIVLIEGKKNSKEGIIIEQPLYINKENGEYTEIVKKMFAGEIDKI